MKIVDQDLQVSNSPGVPVPIRSGTSLSVGTVIARKTPYYRVHLSVQADDCMPGEKWTFSFTAETAGIGPQIPCGKEFLVRNLAPGSYMFALTTGGVSDKREFAIAPVEVTDRNLEVAVTMSTGAEISGRLFIREGMTVPPGRITITVTSVPAFAVGRQIAGAEAGAGSQFLIRALPGIRHHVSVNGLTGNLYVKEIRYNGQIVSDGIFAPLPGASGQLDILIDDHAATIRGLVAGRDQVSARIMVVAMKWPLPREITPTLALLSTAATAPVNDQGEFQIGGLAPGEYRVLALTVDDLSQVQPDAVSRAEQLTLERGASQSVSLHIAQP